MLTRRQLIKRGAVGAGGVMFSDTLLQAALGAQGVANSLTPFMQAVPLPGAGIAVAQQSGVNTYAFSQLLTSAKLHPQLQPTQFFAYDDGHGSVNAQAGSFGLAVVAKKGTGLTMTYKNQLDAYPPWVPVDTRLTYGANSTTPGTTEPRTMTHLHGGLVKGVNDGNPAVTPAGFGGTSPNGSTQTAYYPNNQPATLLWFHDHGLGTTRLNVFAGLAAGYLLYDDVDTGAIDNAIGIPGGPYEIPLVIQDRQFQTAANGFQNFLYPTSIIPGATWIGEYFGDVFLVNGLVWPYLNVEPRKYRLRILNGCNARIMSLNIPGVKMWQIGAEGGMFDMPVPMSKLVLTPAERADVIVDFSTVAGQTIVLKNNTPSPPVSTPAPSLTNVMQLRVGTTVGSTKNNTVPTSLPGQAASIQHSIANTRYITLNELFAGTVDWKLNLNGIPFGDDKYPSPGDPTPKFNTSEEWHWINLTPDTHPMHTHLFTFKVVKRIPFDVKAYKAQYGVTVKAPSNPAIIDTNVPGGIPVPLGMQGPAVPPDPEERGWKDTVKANPGYITVIQMNLDPPQDADITNGESYVHHCHIVEHEDNDMMRQFIVKGSA